MKYKTTMKKLIVVILTVISPIVTYSQFDPIQSDGQYQVHVDIRNIVNDQVQVEVVVPIQRQDSAIYQLPAMIPGTYKVYNFGQFVSRLIAVNSFGDTLKVDKLNVNQWKVNDARGLYKIVYWVDDSYDAKGVDIFAPGGTSIKNDVVLLNSFGYVGYIEGQKDLVFKYYISKPKSYFGTTSLPVLNISDTLDVYQAKDYFQLHDCPAIYTKPDTASILVGNTKIYVGVYSPSGYLNAKEILDGIEPVFHAASSYLAGNLPTEKYSVLVYGMTMGEMMKGMGALEHHTSTVVNMPDFDDKMWEMIMPGEENAMIQMMRDVVSHEFFHIVTPLNIHSQQINDYNFMNPQMSKHLWLYEGVTEYNANISQVRSNVITVDGFIKNMKDKMSSSRNFNESIPFTVSSEGALTYFENEYLNVYEKGALIGMCIDLTLLSETEGKYGLPDLLLDLSQMYGRDTFFMDDELFDIIESVSGSTIIREFFARHVEGAEPLPYKKLLHKVGYNFTEEKKSQVIADGGLSFRLKDDYMIISRYKTSDPLTKQLKFKRGDRMLKWNGKKVNKDNWLDIKAEYTANAKLGDKVVVEVQRNKQGKWKKLKLTGVVMMREDVAKDYWVEKDNPSEKELELRKAWLNN